MSNILITGGAGFIGSHLSERLLLGGHTVVSLDNLDPFYSRELKKENLKIVGKAAEKSRASYHSIPGDIRDGALVGSLLDQYSIDTVYHIAALAGVRPSILNPVRYFDINCTGTCTILEEIRKRKIKNFVFASSSSVYGNGKTVPFCESQPVDNPISPYAATKKAGELLCHNYSHLYGIRTLCIRFFTVYGPRQRPDLAIHKFSKLMLQGKPIPFFGDGQSERDYTYITDICEGLTSCLEYVKKSAYDVLNLGESNTISLSDLVRLLEQNLGVKAILDRKPMQPGDVQRTWADISRAREKLGYHPRVSKEEGIRLFAEWAKLNYSSTTP